MMKTEETRSSPVKYMPLRDEQGYWIADTSLEYGMRPVCSNMTESYAHHICKLLNEAEGYRYGNQES